MQQHFRRLVVWAFERFYHEGAWTYDSVAWLVSRGYWQRWIAAVLPDLDGIAALDLGCGTGYLQRERRAPSPLTVGLDESLPMLRLARRKVRRAGGAPRLLRAVGQALPFADRSWPAVVATFPAPYLFDPATLAEIRRVLAPGGRLLIVDAGVVPPGWHQRLIVFIYRILLGQPESSPESPAPGADPRVVRLEQHGFRVSAEWRTVGAGAVQVLIAEPD